MKMKVKQKIFKRKQNCEKTIVQKKGKCHGLPLGTTVPYYVVYCMCTISH